MENKIKAIITLFKFSKVFMVNVEIGRYHTEFSLYFRKKEEILKIHKQKMQELSNHLETTRIKQEQKLVAI